MENGRVVRLNLDGFGLTGAVPTEIGQLTSLRELHLNNNYLTSVPGAINHLSAFDCRVFTHANVSPTLPWDVWCDPFITEGNSD